MPTFSAAGNCRRSLASCVRPWSGSTGRVREAGITSACCNCSRSTPWRRSSVPSCRVGPRRALTSRRCWCGCGGRPARRSGPPRHWIWRSSRRWCVASRCRRRMCGNSTNYSLWRKNTMTEANTLLLRANLKQLRLPTMQAEYEALAREAATANEGYPQYLLRLTELEVAARAANVLKARIKQAGFPALKDFDSYDFTAQPSLPKLKVLELAGGEWLAARMNICFVGNSGT